MQWNDNYIKEVERTVSQRVQAAGYFLVSRIRENISIPSRTVSFKQISRGKNKGKTKKVLGARGSNRSKPGQFPHKDFGRLRMSIAQDHRGLITRVGTNVPYGKFLELGTAKMAARPFLRRTLAEERQKIEDMIRFGPSTDIR
jgi:HK97 gp10 family phage protein